MESTPKKATEKSYRKNRWVWRVARTDFYMGRVGGQRAGLPNWQSG